jgi:hypothetical protein
MSGIWLLKKQLAVGGEISLKKADLPEGVKCVSY